MTAIALNMNDTKDVLMIFDELEVQNSLLYRGDDFSSISLSTSSRQRVSRLRCMSRTTVHANYDQANKLVLVFVLGSKA